MPTENLGLPTISGNMTADVVRDMNALAEAVDAAAGVDGSLASKSDLGAIDVKLDKIDQGVVDSNAKSDQIKQDVDQINSKLNNASGKTLKSVYYDTNGTYSFQVPSGVTTVYITAGGAGGGGGNPAGQTGGTGGATSFSNLLTLSGGGGGLTVGGVAGGKGASQGSGGIVGSAGVALVQGGAGGSSGFFSATLGGGGSSGANGANCCGGAGGANSSANGTAAGGGGGAFVYRKPLTVTALSTHTITIGTGGAGGGTMPGRGGDGGDGMMLIEWWE